MRLLLIEDNTSLREATRQYMQEAGFVIDTAATGDEGLWAAQENPYDVVLLDLMLPKVNGMEILRRLRAKENPVHILVMSARDGLDDRLQALDAGADDYLVKPFALSEVLARTRALLRRSYQRKNPIMRVANLTLDPNKLSVQRGDEAINLTALEYRLLEYLFHRTGEVVSRAEIWEHVFEDGSGGNSNIIEVYIGYLRKKINAGNELDLIHTKRGHGYILEDRP